MGTEDASGAPYISTSTYWSVYLAVAPGSGAGGVSPLESEGEGAPIGALAGVAKITPPNEAGVSVELGAAPRAAVVGPGNTAVKASEYPAVHWSSATHPSSSY